MEIIRSRQNPLAKHLIKLSDSRKERQAAQQTLLLGTHLIESAIQAKWPLERIFVCEKEEGNPEISALLNTNYAPVTMLDRIIFAEIEQTASTVGILALSAIPTPEKPQTSGFCLLLENLQDPGNVGSILRSAAAAGVEQVWLSLGCADVWSPKVLRAGMGAHFVLPLIDRILLQQTLPKFQGKITVTSLKDSETIYDADLRGDMVLAFGHEGAGISTTLLNMSTQRLFIPMMPGSVESLNVAAAAAVCLFERSRQIK